MPTLAVIFDMDGVLVDSYDAHFLSWSRLNDELGLKYSEADFAADFGRTGRDILTHRFGNEFSEDRLRQLDEHKEALYRDVLREHFPAMDGATELIDALTADGFRLAVGSSGPPENIALCLEKLERTAKFTAVVNGLDVTRGKPDPQVFLLAAQKLGVPAESCVVIEDAVHGIAAANRAGMKSIALVGTATRDQLATADMIINSLRELTPAKIRGLIAN